MTRHQPRKLRPRELLQESTEQTRCTHHHFALVASVVSCLETLHFAMAPEDFVKVYVFKSDFGQKWFRNIIDTDGTAMHVVSEAPRGTKVSTEAG